MNNPFLLPHYFTFILAVFNFAFGTLIYLKNIVQKKVEPNLSTWIIWGLAPISSFVISVLEGSLWLDILAVLTAGFGPLCIVVVSLVTKNYYLKSKKLDLICFFLSILGLTLYFSLKSSEISQLILVASDLIASIPILSKIWRDKNHGEPFKVFALVTFLQVVGLFTTTQFTFQNSFFLIYLISINTAITVSISINRKSLLPS